MTKVSAMHIQRVTPGLLALLRRQRVFTALSGGDRWRLGEFIAFPNDCRIEPFSELFEGHRLPRAFGAFSYSHSEVGNMVRAGRYCSFARGIAWMGLDHPMDWAGMSPIFHDTAQPAMRAFRAQFNDQGESAPWQAADRTVTIGNDVWIGDEAMIAPGITIGDGAVIGARALVRADVPAYAIVVGQPARVTRYRFPEPLIARFLALQWWRFSPAVVGPLPVTDPERFLDALAEKIAREALRPMAPVCLTAPDILAAADQPAGDSASDLVG